MKIALLTIGGVDRSGAGRVIPCLLWLIEQLTKAGHEVHVFVPMQETMPGTWPLLGATIHNGGRGAWRLRMLGSIAREHSKARFDVVHAFWTSMGVIGAVTSKLLDVPMVLTLPGGDVVGIPEIGYGGTLTFRGRAALRVATAAASRTTVPSDFMRKLAGEKGIDTVTVPLGVDLERWPAMAPRARDSSRPVKLVHVASLNRVKDQDTLLHAIRILRSRGCFFELRMVGWDTLAGEIQRQARKLGLDAQVRFLGVLNQAELREQYEWADLLVMASRHEAGPLVMLEAALAGVPTVGTRVGHLADHSPDAAFAVPIGNPAALADAICEVASNEARRISLALAAQAFSASHDATFTARAFTGLYRQVRRPRSGFAAA